MNNDMNPNSNIEEAKSRLPLPKLMAELGYSERAKSSARCPFHSDQNPSFGIFQKDGQWFWKCQAGCGHGNEIHFLAKAKGIDIKEATKEFLRMAGVEIKAKRPTSTAPVSAPKQSGATDTTPPKPKRERIEKLARPTDPVTFEQWRSMIESNFPALLRPAEACLSVVTQLLLNDVSNPFALALVDVPSSGKTITLNFFSGIDELTYTSDSFTPASFVSNSSSVKREQLDDIDLLPRIQYRTLVVRELGTVFGAKEDDLIKSFATLTRVLDGEGLQTDTGVHGRRGYTGDYLFMLLGGTPPIAPRVFKIMGNFGSRLFFLALHTPEEQEDDLIAQNMGEDRKSREITCQKITEAFLRTLWAANQSGIAWNKRGDPVFCLRVIARCARLLAHLRGAINVWPVGEDGKLTHSIPTIEKPNRINCLFYNLARGHALACGRRQLTAGDLWPVLDLTFDSAPRTRAGLFRGLIEAGGTLTTSQVQKLLHCSKPTALKEMEALSVLEVVEKTELTLGEGHPETHITLDKRFEWFATDECNGLLTGMEARAQGGNPLLTHPAAANKEDVAVTGIVNKEIAPFTGVEIICSGMTNRDCRCKSCEDFRQSKWVYPSNEPEWVKLEQGETQPHWQAALRDALAKPCAVCGERMGNDPHLWLSIKNHAVQCCVCRETLWWADGYDVEDGLPDCWNHEHTREERIAERERNQLQKAARYRARVEGVEYAKMYEALLAQEADEIRLAIGQLDTKERREDEVSRAAWEAYQKTDEWKAYNRVYGPPDPEHGMTAGKFLADATALFNATPAN